VTLNILWKWTPHHYTRTCYLYCVLIGHLKIGSII